MGSTGVLSLRPPARPRLHGSHDGLAGPAKVFAGVLMRTGIAAADVTARQAHSRDDEVLRSVLHGLDLEEATLNRI